MSKRLNLSFIKVGLALLIINFYYVIVYLHLYFPDPIPMTDKTTQQFKKIKKINLQFHFFRLRLPPSLVLVLEGVLILVPLEFSLR